MIHDRSSNQSLVAVVLCLVSILLCASTGSALRLEQRPMELKVGQPFPTLRLPTLDGGFKSIADFRGKKVILHVFASW